MKNLEERIVSALRAYCDNKDCLHIPARDTDIDVVLGDALNQIKDLKQQIKELHASRESLLEYKNKIESSEFVLVPREATKEVIIGLASGYLSEDGIPWLDPEQSYKEMLSAIEAVESGKFNSDIQAMNKDLSNGVITGENFDNLSDDRSSGGRP